MAYECSFGHVTCVGSGKGGMSIWGKKFEDEFKETLKVSSLTDLLLYIASWFIIMLLLYRSVTIYS